MTDESNNCRLKMYFRIQITLQLLYEITVTANNKAKNNSHKKVQSKYPKKSRNSALIF